MLTYSPSIRLYVNFPLKKEANITLQDKQAHYLFNVMRLKIGRKFLVFNGTDGEFEAEIINKLNNKIKCKLTRKTREQPEEPRLNLIFSLVKKDRVFNIIEKCTELGVSNFQPIISERTQNKNFRLERFQLNAVEASEQTNRLTIPRINKVQKLSEVIEGWNKNDTIIFCNENGGKPIVDILNNISRPLSILIGPEGGFSKKELEYFVNFDFIKSVSLGPRILRADTAAIASVTCYQSFVGDWSVSNE